jgi:hypothetical protein
MKIIGLDLIANAPAADGQPGDRPGGCPRR